MQLDTKVPYSAYSPTPNRRNREQNLLSSYNENDSSKQFNEKTVYRSQKLPDLKENNKLTNEPFSRASTAFPRYSFKDDESNTNNNSNNRAQTSKLRNRRQLNHNNKRDAEDLDWNNLGVKIEDWFESAKTPDQKIVYRFLKDIKDEEFDRESASSVMTNGSNLNDKAQSLEDILDNLKKYRHKFNRSSMNKSNARASSSLPKPKYHQQSDDLEDLNTNNNNNLNKSANDFNKQIFESSTWRVMRHLKSADIRNKYPLPKANPDYHFRNATIFHTCGRPPKSTFLLHPDWV